MSDDLALRGTSPFDTIRRTRPDGSEFWSARELMPLMGYARWNEFKTPLDRAMKSAANQGQTAADLFSRSPEKSGGRPREDFELTRFAAYLVAMNGDPNKAEVAAAQAYFANQTRTAEVAAVQQSSISVFDLMRAQIDQIEVAQREAAEAKAIASRTDARLDAIEGRHDWFAALGYARANGIENTSSKFLASVGRQASAIAKANGIAPVKIQHALYGEVNSLPAWVWERAFDGRSEA